MKRFFRLLICFVFILSTVALYACGGNKGNGGKTDDSDVILEDVTFDEYGYPVFPSKITLNVWSVIGDPDKAYLELVNKQFNDTFKANNVEANITSIETNLFYTQFANTLNTDPDNAPDVVIFHSERLTNLADNKMIVPIESALKSINQSLDTNNYLSNILSECYAKGSLYAVPLDVHSGFWYVRDDILQKNGLSRPTTFAEIESVCQALMDKKAAGTLWVRSMDRNNASLREWRQVGPESDFYPLEMSGENDNMECGWIPQTAVLQNGGTFCDKNGYPAWNTNKGLETVLNTIKGWKGKYIGANRNYETLWANLGNGNAVFGFEGSWWAESRLNEYDSVLGEGSMGVMGLSKLFALDPTSKDADKVYGVGHCFALSRSVTNAKVKAAGALYSKYMTENSIKYMKGGHLPACFSVINNPEYTSSTEYNRYLKYMGDPANFQTLGNTKYFKPVYEQLKMTYMYTLSKNKTGEVKDFIAEAYQKAMSTIRAEEDL